jgi:NAD-dependent deacetylase
MSRKKIVVFSGAGLDKESGVDTFRDTDNGLWYNYKIDEVATTEGWKKDKSKVLDFHNMLREALHKTKPNSAHKLLAELDTHFDVTHVTQNVSDLLEKAGCKNILHLHGELMKCRSTLDPELYYDCRGSLNLGDKCIKGSQLRPHTVFFGEYPFNMEESTRALSKADYLIMVGTSFQIHYTVGMMDMVGPNTKVYYIDPDPVDYFEEGPQLGTGIKYIKKTATKGVKEVFDELYSKIL